MNFLELTLEQWIDIGLSITVLLATAILGRWVIRIILAVSFFVLRVSRRIHWMMLFWTQSPHRFIGWL